MRGMDTRPDDVRILLSEGSSTNAREIITALGLSGYRVDVCDPSPLCQGRFSRFVGTVHRCPVSGQDPIGYLRFVIELLQREHYDVLLPANEQAYLFSWARELLEPLAGLAVADFAAFERVQTKSAFTRLLVELGLGHPATCFATTWEDVERATAELGLPCYVKVSSGTASTGVWRVDDEGDLADLREALVAQSRMPGPELVVQQVARGAFEQSHGIFDHGRLVAVCCTRRVREGAQGGAAVKQAVTRPAVTDDYRVMGEALTWHGSFSADYIWDECTGTACYIDANPRLTEPMNAYFDGVDLPRLQIELSLSRHPARIQHTSRSARSHAALQGMLGAATRDGSRRSVLRELVDVTLRRADYRGSREGMTPILRDPPALVPLAAVLGTLLLSPPAATPLALSTIERYSLGDAVDRISRTTLAAAGLA
jgi:predicted ATP-grasp superfamily ATP-dependent carboligase